MKKSTSENLSNRLLKYGAFSAALLGVANASGQIIYTDIADETVDALNPRVALDIDVDGTGDYLFGANSSSIGFAFMFPASTSSAPSLNSNGIVGFNNSSYNYVSNLVAGDIINSTNGILTGVRGDFNYSSCAFPGSEFCDGNDAFVGLHFKIGANTHYGWVRIQVAPSAASIIIKDFAYNATPEGPIEAGQTSTLSVDTFTMNNVRVVSLNKSIALYNLPGNTSYNLFSATGQSLLSGTTNNQTYVIEASTMASGIYILELNDTANNSLIRKKIVL